MTRLCVWREWFVYATSHVAHDMIQFVTWHIVYYARVCDKSCHTWHYTVRDVIYHVLRLGVWRVMSHMTLYSSWHDISYVTWLVAHTNDSHRAIHLRTGSCHVYHVMCDMTRRHAMSCRRVMTRVMCDVYHDMTRRQSCVTWLVEYMSRTVSCHVWRISWHDSSTVMCDMTRRIYVTNCIVSCVTYTMTWLVDMTRSCVWRVKSHMTLRVVSRIT